MSKRLQVDYIDVVGLEYGESTCLKNRTLYISQSDLFSRIDTSMFASAEIIIARPGEDVRILGVADCTQPRVKADDPEATFPGLLGKVVPAGDGRTLALRGILVTELYPLKANIKTLLDMNGPIADISMFSRHNHIILDFRPKEGVEAATFAQAQKIAALTIAVYLAKLGLECPIDESRVYELTPVGPGKDGKPLPKVAYVTSQWAGFDTQQFFFYGQSAIGSLPFVVHPNEILDGALVYRYYGEQYHYQEEAVIKELYDRHGKDIEFVGMIVTCGKTETTAKNVSSMIGAQFAKEYLHADIVLNTKIGMHHCQLEQQMIHIWSEKMGMKSVCIMPAVSNEKPGDLMIISDPRVDAVIHSGCVGVMEYPYMPKLIGVPDIPALMAFDLHGPFTITTNGSVAGNFSFQGANHTTESLDVKTTGWRMPE